MPIYNKMSRLKPHLFPKEKKIDDGQNGGRAGIPNANVKE